MVGRSELSASSSWRTILRRQRVIFGAGSLAELGGLTWELGGQRVLVVTDPGIRRAGHVESALSSLEGSGLEGVVFDEVEENPTSRHAEAGAAFGQQHQIDFLVALGGGSAMDCAKGLNFLLTNGGKMEDYWGMNKASRPMLTSIGIPCTAGTGSEAQSFALISRVEDHRKMACGDEKARFHTVIMDPEVARTVPQKVAAVAGLDAVSHAVESYVTAERNPLAQLFAREAWRLLEQHYPSAVTGTAPTEIWAQMLLGSHLAGCAIETSMLGAAHACANPLTARYGVTHGIAVALMLPHVVRFNAKEVDDLYRDLAEVAGLATGGRGGERLAERIVELRALSELPERLRDVGVEKKGFPELAQEAAEQWTAQHNPRKVGEAELRKLYESAY